MVFVHNTLIARRGQKQVFDYKHLLSVSETFLFLCSLCSLPY